MGKSTLLNALLGERLAIVSPKPQTTRDRILGILTRKDTQFLFLDTPGLHAAKTKLGQHMNAVAHESIEGADVVVLVTEPEVGIQATEKAVLEGCVSRAEGSASRPVILALNKVDTVKDKTKLLPILQGLGESFAFAAIVPISGRREDGLDRLLEEIEQRLPEMEHPYGSDELTDKPVRFLVAELVREQVLHRAWQEVPHGVAVVIESFEEGDRLIRINATIHVPKETHKRILIGKSGSFLVAVGKSAREAMEKMLDRKVHLELWVRVTPDWYDKDDLLKQVGYGSS